MLSNVAWGEAVIQPTTNSSSQAALETKPRTAPLPSTQVDSNEAKSNTQELPKVPTTNTDESEKDNSLAIQENNVKVEVKKESQTSSPKKFSNSLFDAVLEKQARPYK